MPSTRASQSVFLHPFGWLQVLPVLRGTGLALAVAGSAVFAQPQASPPASPASSAAKPSAAGASQKKWKDLTPAEQTALKPLQSDWRNIGPERQRKWLEISKGYASMTLVQQEALHARMGEWAKLSPVERAGARLNFAKAQEASKSLTPEEKRAKWEAYQSLSPEEKRKLAEARPFPKGAALAVTPVPAKKLATLPANAAKPSASAARGTPAVKVPKIAVSPELVNQQTLLPQSGHAAPVH